MLRKAFLLAVATLLAAPALAQDVDFHAGPEGVSMHAGAPEERDHHHDGEHRDHHDREERRERHAVQTSASMEGASEGYRLAYERNHGGATMIRALEPEGAPCQVWDGRRMVAEDDLPMSFEARPERFYRIVVRLADGSVFEKKVSAKRGQVASLWVAPQMAPPPPPAAPVFVPEPVPAVAVPVEQGPYPMDGRDFMALKSAIAGETFSAQKLSVLETAIPSAWLTVSQLGQIVDLFEFGNDRVKAVQLCADHLVDRQNAYQLYSHFEFDSEKEQVKHLLGR